MPLHQRLDAPNFIGTEPTIACQPYRVEPKPGNVDLSLDLNMWRPVAISGGEEKTLRANSEHCGHSGGTLGKNP